MSFAKFLIDLLTILIKAKAMNQKPFEVFIAFIVTVFSNVIESYLTSVKIIIFYKNEYY